MRKVKILISLICIAAFFINARSQDSKTEIQSILERINKEVPPEEGCTKKAYSFDKCTFKCTLECGGNEFVFSFKMKDIKRVYKDKADLGDQFETLFFECKGERNCITCSSEQIPPSPVFPIRLPEDESNKLGEDAVKAFSSAVEECK